MHFFQFRKRQIGDDGPALVKQFVQMAVEQQPPVPRHAIGDGPLGADGRRAIVRERVIPFRPFVERIDAAQIVEEQRPAAFSARPRR